MGWEWFSTGSISDEQLRQAINRLKETAWVHDQINFPGDPQPDSILTRLKNSVNAGYMKIACNVLANGSVDQTFFFQKSKWLTSELGTDVWNVSYGFDQQLLSDNADQDECRTFVRDNMTPTMDTFMALVDVTSLFSIEYGPLDSTSDGSKVDRLQTLGVGEQWDVAGTPKTYSGTDPVHEYWGKQVDENYEFTVYRIARL